MTATGWEKIFIDHTSDQNQYLEFKKKKGLKLRKKYPIRKWAKDVNRFFTKEDIQMTSKHMQRCSASLAAKEMQFKTTGTSLQTYKNDRSKKVTFCVGEVERNLETGSPCALLMELPKPPLGGHLKTKRETTLRPSNCTLGHLSWRNEDFRSHKNLHTSV